MKTKMKTNRADRQRENAEVNKARAFIRGFIRRNPDVVASYDWHLHGGRRQQFRNRLFVDGCSYPPDAWALNMAVYLRLLESKPDAEIYCPYRGVVTVRNWHKGCFGHFLDVRMDQVGPFMYILADLHLQGELNYAPDEYFEGGVEGMRSFTGETIPVDELHRKARLMLECNRQCWGLGGHFPSPPNMDRETSAQARAAVDAYRAEFGPCP